MSIRTHHRNGTLEAELKHGRNHSGTSSPLLTDADRGKASTRKPTHVPVETQSHQVNYDSSVDSRAFAMRSPVSQAPTRCPSLTGSQSGLTSMEHSPTTSISEMDTASIASHNHHPNDSYRHYPPPIPPQTTCFLDTSATPSFPYPRFSEEERTLDKNERRRRNHLNSEKRRRENIKGGMDALVEIVPTCRNLTESKANILKKTKEYIIYLMNAFADAQMEIKRLRAENVELRRLVEPQSRMGIPMGVPSPGNLAAYRGGASI